MTCAGNVFDVGRISRVTRSRRASKSEYLTRSHVILFHSLEGDPNPNPNPNSVHQSIVSRRLRLPKLVLVDISLVWRIQTLCGFVAVSIAICLVECAQAMIITSGNFEEAHSLHENETCNQNFSVATYKTL